MSDDICVVHLVRKKNGMEPFLNFLASYQNYPAGIDHSLLIIYKGFYRKSRIAVYEELLADIPHSILMVADFGFDLRPYFMAAKKYDSKYFCFLNSFSLIQDKDWLLKLYQHINRPGVGLVGATGSWQGLQISNKKKRPLWKTILSPFVRLYFRTFFDYFPNHHLRTNGFMIARDTLLKVRCGTILTKMQAYFMESGKNNITRQVERMGLRPVVVGRDGKGYEKNEWDVSNTFWRGTQHNLLVSDNQTRKFDTAGSEWRRNLELYAWGALAHEPQTGITENS